MVFAKTRKTSFPQKKKLKSCFSTKIEKSCLSVKTKNCVFDQKWKKKISCKNQKIVFSTETKYCILCQTENLVFPLNRKIAFTVRIKIYCFPPKLEIREIAIFCQNGNHVFHGKCKTNFGYI